jgi:hypothetical protein
MTRTNLSDILTEEQIAEAVRILKTTKDEHVVKQLTKYFAGIQPSLEQSKGVLPAYLAWVLYAKFTLHNAEMQ